MQQQRHGLAKRPATDAVAVWCPPAATVCFHGDQTRGHRCRTMCLGTSSQALMSLPVPLRGFCGGSPQRSSGGSQSLKEDSLPPLSSSSSSSRSPPGPPLGPRPASGTGASGVLYPWKQERTRVRTCGHSSAVCV